MADDGKQRAKVLVADDSKLVRVSAKKMLSADYALVFAEDGEQAWTAIEQDSDIQMLFTDLTMPNLDGYGLIERIRSSDSESIRNLPVVVITGAADNDEVRRRAYEAGATDFIAKPFNATELAARVESHTSYRRDTENLHKNVNIDLLTGALNTKGLQTQLEKDVAFVNRHGENLALITFELDDFDNIAKRIGKPTTEQIIKHVVSALLKAVRKEDSVSRIGLGQFVVVLPMAKTEGVILLARRLGNMVKSLSLKVGGAALPLTMSAGISAVLKGSHVELEELKKASTQALVLAKDTGPGEVQIIKLESSDEEEAVDDVAIDELIKQISMGKDEIDPRQIDAAIVKLAPLIALMSSEQRQSLIE